MSREELARVIYRAMGFDPAFVTVKGNGDAYGHWELAGRVADAVLAALSTPAPSIDAEAVERVARAIDDATVGYSINLTKLVDGVSEYTLTYPHSGETLTFTSYSDANEHVANRAYIAKAEAAIAALSPAPAARMEAEREELAERCEGWAVSFAEKCNEVEAAKSIIRDCLKELDRSQRPSYAWQLRAKATLEREGRE